MKPIFTQSDPKMLSRMADIAITGGLRDCSLAEIFISVLERARGSGGVKLPPLRLMPEQQHEEC